MSDRCRFAKFCDAAVTQRHFVVREGLKTHILSKQGPQLSSNSPETFPKFYTALMITMNIQCTFHKFGTSGEVEKHDALCLLPLNIVNEKVYIFLWFWSVL